MIRNYITVALRNLFRNKIYSAINIAGLSIGLACAMLIILYTKDEVSYDRFHKNVENIHRITIKRHQPNGILEGQTGSTGYMPGPFFAKGIPEVKSFLRIQSTHIDIKDGTEISSMEVHSADSNFFSFFSFSLEAGNPSTALNAPKTIVITEDIAKKHFGTTEAFGKSLMIRTNSDSPFEPYQVTGVADNPPQNSSVKFSYLLPLEVDPTATQDKTNWFNSFLNTFVKLQPGADIKVVEGKMKQVFDQDAAEAKIMMAEKFGDRSITTHLLQPMLDMHLSKDFPADNGLADSSNPMYSYILSGIALFILIIACINFINLTVARSLKRAREIGIRKVVGGERKQLIAQFMGESLILCLGAFLFAIVLVQLSLPVFNHLSNKALALSYLFDAKLVFGYAILFFVTAFMAGFYPALVLSSFNPVQTLYSRFRLAGKNYLQKSLVVLQFVLATILIIATVTIYNQFNYLTKKELGYDASNVVLVDKMNLLRPEVTVFKDELYKNPAVLEVATKNGGQWGTIARIQNDSTIHFDYETVDENYLPLYKIPLVKGRNFSKDFPSDSANAVLVNESFVKKAGWDEPIGKEVNFWYRNQTFKVIGVVKDYHHQSLYETIKPQLFTMNPQNPLGLTIIRIKPNSATSAIPYIEATFRKLFPLHPWRYGFKQDENLRMYQMEEKWKQMMLFGAFLTIFISCIGLFGLSVLSAEKRTKEIGIRKVLGASVAGVATSLSTDFLKLVITSLFIAIPIAWIACNKWLEIYPYRIKLSSGMFIFSGLIVIAIALFTVSFQAIRAARANPVKSLRTE